MVVPLITLTWVEYILYMGIKLTILLTCMQVFIPVTAAEDGGCRSCKLFRCCKFRAGSVLGGLETIGGGGRFDVCFNDIVFSRNILVQSSTFSRST